VYETILVDLPSVLLTVSVVRVLEIRAISVF